MKTCISIDLAALSGYADLTSGTHSITVVAKADGYRSSVHSEAVSYTKQLPQLTTPAISLSGTVISITNYNDTSAYSNLLFSWWADTPSGGQVNLGDAYNGVKELDLASEGIQSIFEGAGRGTYSIWVIALADNYTASEHSNEISYTYVPQLTTPVIGINSTNSSVVEVTNYVLYTDPVENSVCTWMLENEGGEQYTKSGSEFYIEWDSFLREKGATSGAYTITCQASADDYKTSEWSSGVEVAYVALSQLPTPTFVIGDDNVLRITNTADYEGFENVVFHLNILSVDETSETPTLTVSGNTLDLRGYIDENMESTIDDKQYSIWVYATADNGLNSEGSGTTTWYYPVSLPTPTIAFDTTDTAALSITNYSSFPSGTIFWLYKDGEEVAELGNVDGKNLSDYDWDAGTYSIQVGATCDGYTATISDSLTFTVALPTPSITISSRGLLTVSNYSDYSTYTNVTFNCHLMDYDEIEYNTTFSGSTFDLKEYIETFIDEDSSNEFTVAVKVSATDCPDSAYCAGVNYVYSEYDFDVTVGDGFSISYEGNTPDAVIIDPSNLATYTDDGGVLEFGAATAGTGTVTIAYGNLGEGQYETSTVYKVRVSEAATKSAVGTWYFNDTIDLSSATSLSMNVDFSLQNDITTKVWNSGGTSYTTTTILKDSFYDICAVYNPDKIEEWLMYYGKNSSGTKLSEQVYHYSYSEGYQWDVATARTITITGGTDAENADLIAWLEANATKQS